MAACSSLENRTLFHVEAKAIHYYMYPPPVARYEDVIANPKIFMDTLGNFHAAMGTKFMIPIIGGKDLNLHRLFVEVTSRGGIKKVLEEKKWREVTNSFNFPPSATNASFILRKYYMSLIYHFEQVYYFKAKAWTPVSNDTWQSTKHSLTSTSGMNKTQLPLPESQVPSAETQALSMKRQRTSIEDISPKASPKPSIDLPVTGVIDGKFDNGYLCTVMIGGEPLQGVLFKSTAHTSYQPPNHQNVATQCQATSGNETQPLTMVKRRRRKKWEMKKRDPAHPKTNRSGYNFFFAEQHARLKPLHPGKDRDISRMIGELWNNITESQKAVYQEKAMKDKERYKIEMEHYREGLRTGHTVSHAALLQHLFNETPEIDDEGSHQTHGNEINSACSDKSSFEYTKTSEKDSNVPLPEVGGEECTRDVVMDPKNDLFLLKENGPVIAERVSIQENELIHDEETHHAELTRVLYEPEPLNESIAMNENLEHELDVLQ